MAADKFLFQSPTASSYEMTRPFLPMKIDGFDDADLFFTDVSGNFDVNYQLNYAFNDDTYIYAFGERLSVLNVTGLALQSNCPDTQITVKNFVEFYKKFKLSATKTGTLDPVTIWFGGQDGIQVEGFFIGMVINLVGGNEDVFQMQIKMLGRVIS